MFGQFGGRIKVETVCALANPEIIPEFGAVPYSPTQIMYLQADTSTLRDDLGWKPKMEFSAGISRTIEWLKSQA